MALAPVVTPLGTRLGRMFDLSPRSVGWIAWAGGAGAVLAGATLLLATDAAALVVANLLEDLCVPGLINLECFIAVRTDDIMHNYVSFLIYGIGLYVAFP